MRPTLPALCIKFDLLATLVSNLEYPFILFVKFFRFRQKSITVLQNGKVIELSPIFVAIITFYLILLLNSLSYSYSE